jgi:glycosyltransferase involved in cell wall biosynthesis
VIAPHLPRGALQHIRTVSCIRPLLTPELAAGLATLRSRGALLVADYDDLLFAGNVAGVPASVGGRHLGSQSTRFEQYAAGLAAFDRFTVTTRALAKRLLALQPEASVTVVPNGISEGWRAQGRALYRAFGPEDPKVIRYFSGSPSHDFDFASIIEPLSSFLREHPSVRLEVVGPLNFDQARFPSGSVARLTRVGYEELPGLLASTWVNLAPLEPTPFNDCKSALKLLESGAFDCPTLASPNDDVLRHAELGAPVVICNAGRDWYEALGSMLDLDRRRTVGGEMAEHVERFGLARRSLSAWSTGLELGTT